MRVLWLFTAALAFILPAQSPASAAEKSMIEKVKERGVLRAGIKDSVPYLGFIDEKGMNVGFEIDLVTDLAKRLGVKIEYTPTKASTRVQLLKQGRIDLVMATMTHYRRRDEVLDFSIAYLYAPQTMLVKCESGIEGLDDAAGKRIGTALGAGTVRNFPKAQPKATMQTFEGWPESFFALERGMVDAVATDNIILAALRSGSPNPEKYCLVGKEGIYGGGYYAIALLENDSDSRDTINFLLQDQWLDGTWQKAFDKWLGKDSKLNMKSADFANFGMRTWNP